MKGKGVLFLAALAAMSCLLVTAGCGTVGTDDVSQVDSLGSEVTAGMVSDDAMQTVTGRYCKTTKDAHLIITDDGSPIVMNGSAAMFQDLRAGDRIEITCDMILETYPGQTAVSGCRLLERGSKDDLPADTLKALEELDWHLLDDSATA